jgi:hypothetical protein
MLCQVRSGKFRTCKVKSVKFKMFQVISGYNSVGQIRLC